MKKRLALVFISLIFVLISSIFADKVFGAYLRNTGYFKATNPSQKILVEASEFKNEINISSQGIRNDYVTVPKPKDTYRILALGDSFTFGWGVNLNETWIKQLESGLKMDGKKIEVINAAVTGMDLVHEIQTCVAYKDYMEIDAVILGHYSNLDLYQILNRNNETNLITNLWPNFINYKNRIIINNDNNDEFIEIRANDYWKNQAKNILAENLANIKNVAPEILTSFIEGKINPAQVQFALIDPFYYLAIFERDNLNKSLQELDNKLSILKKDCVGNKPVYFVYLPSSDMVSREYQDVLSKIGYKMDEKLLSFSTDNQLESIVKKHGFVYLSLLSEFRKDGCPECFYFIDSHLTPLGNKRVSDFLLSHIKL